MKIFWTKKSKRRFLEINKYIESEFGTNTSEKFKSNVVDFLELLSKFPELGTIEVEDKKIYGFQISRHTRIFYRITKSNISLLTFFDSRQNPKNKPR